MAKINISLFPADTYIVKNCTVLNSDSRIVLTKLYQPVIGSTAITLYLTLWDNLDTSQIISTENTHHNLMAITRLKLEDILDAREKLEGIGLIKTYLKKGSVNNYIYELYSPLYPKEFLENPILSVTLESNIGTKEYEKVVKYFSLPKINLQGYEDISCSFSDTFEITSAPSYSEERNIRHISELGILIDSKIDLTNVISMIPSEILNKRSITKDTKDLIYKLAFVYNLSESDLSELIRNSINEKHIIDKEKLRTNCHNYYTFENKGETPSLIYKSQPEYLRKQVSSNSKKSKMIHTFETMTPYDFLSGKNKGVRPSKRELGILETLLVDYNLPPGVVNVLIDYVLKINDGKLTKNFILAIAAQWTRENIKTVEDAMELCKKENKSKQTRAVKKVVQKEATPDWFNKQIGIKEATTEDIAKLEEQLQNL